MVIPVDKDFDGVNIACYAEPVLATIGLSVRLSVRLSHAGTE